MSPHIRRALRDDRGFTLIEVMVTVTLSLVVLFAILGASEIFGKSATTIDRSTGAQDSARTTMRTMVATMRQARFAPSQTSPVPSTWAPSRSDLTFAAYVPSTDGTTTVAGWVRYCAVTTGTQSSLIAGARIGDAYMAPGPCSATDTTNGWSHATMLNGTLQGPAQLFDFTSAACTGAACLPAGPEVRAVGIRIGVGTSRVAVGTHNSVVRDAVSFRNRSSS